MSNTTPVTRKGSQQADKAKKQANYAGSFIDRKTGQLVVVYRKKGESTAAAMSRVRRKHGA